jgi:AI-2 transport protein TqsA
MNGTLPPADPERTPWKARVTLTTVTACLLIVATSWYLLKEFALLLRPLLLAVFLCYVILPLHLHVRRRVPGPAAVVLLVAASVSVLYLLALMVQGSVNDLSDELPRLTARANELLRRAQASFGDALPWLEGLTGTVAAGEGRGNTPLREVERALANAAAGALTEAVVVGIYLLFLLLEVRRFPQRVRDGFPDARAEQILAVAGHINLAMASYLKVKVKASLVLAVPVTLVLWALGVKFALLWGVLTFACNFIPYVGSIVACALPVALAFLDLDLGWRPVAVAVLLVSLHMLSAYVVEPSMTGKAVGLSPLVILVSLAFWSQCWGLTGMFLAVPLTVMFKIVLENVAFTRPYARLMAED